MLLRSETLLHIRYRIAVAIIASELLNLLHYNAYENALHGSAYYPS